MAMYSEHKDTKFAVGDFVKVNYKIIEDEKERTQPFEGIVIGIRGSKDTKTFTVRKIASHNVGVERIFPLNSPWIKNVKVLRQGMVRRAKLNYLRKREGKKGVYVKEKK